MKRIAMIFCLTLIIFSSSRVKATEFSPYLPGGKNYIDYNNILAYDEHFELDESVKVKANTDYTFSFPGYSILDGTVSLYIASSEIYLSGDISVLDNCVTGEVFHSCTFHTSLNEERISIEIDNQDIARFYDAYGVENIQLEEGLVRTDYESYIEGEIVDEEPLIEGSGLFINSYDSPVLLSEIIDNHFTAYDEIDGDLTSSIIVENENYSGFENLVGNYTVSLSVADSSLNKSFFTLLITIKDGVEPIISGPEMIEYSFSDVDDIMNIIENNFAINDEIDDYVDIEIITDEYSANAGILGNYDVSFKVIDGSDNFTIKSFIINVIDNQGPILTSSNTLVSNLSSPLSLEEVLESLEFSDNYDSLDDVVLNVLNNDFYGNGLVVGKYPITIELVDSSNNKTTEIIWVEVNDDVKPVISGLEDLTISYKSDIDLEDIIDLLEVSDNYDDLSVGDLMILDDSFSNNVGIIGSYEIYLSLSDESGNTSTHSISILVIDDIKPLIYVDSYIITINQGSSFNEDDAIDLLKRSFEIDNDDYEVTTLVNEYEGNEKKVGNYIYKIRLTSSSGEELEKEFIVKVVNFETDSSLLKQLSPRNISVYTFVLIFSIFIIIKKRK